MNKKVVIGLSGGVDSSVAAFLLKQQGYEVIAVSLLNGYPGEEDIKKDALRIAKELDIQIKFIDIHEDFKKQIVDYMINSYYNGETPNPCIFCNRLIKFKYLFDVADSINADFVATGHYADIVKTKNGRFSIKAAADESKDQTYFLYQLPQEYLKRLIMPLSSYDKSDVRKIAEDNNIHVFKKKDSQEICFVANDDYVSFIANERKLLPSPGNFVDINGNILGKHKGIIYYTIGQRKGLGIALGQPAYVNRINPENNEVVLGDNGALFQKEVYFRKARWMSVEKPDDEELCLGKVRYRHKPVKCNIKALEDDLYLAVFDEAVRAHAPGQAIVFYKDNIILGGGIITKS